MLRGLEGWHIVIIVGIVVLLFGSRKLPDAARSMGQSLRIFKSEMKAAAKDDSSAADAQPAAAAQPQAVEATAAPQAARVADAVATPVAEQR
jgi:sec-independent protein translocase protein TatA